jgi:predicted glycoside hydrolase/deacetylase ChbG (UPF0249 family)
VSKWRQLGSTLEIGWHPNLTLDSPLSQESQVRSLTQSDGTFWPLKHFLRRWFLGLLDREEIEREWQSQLERFIALVGHPPTFVNCHQHVGVFAPMGDVLARVLGRLKLKPYVRRIQEPWPLVRDLAGARLKRSFLGWLGRRQAHYLDAHGFPGNDWLAGITTPECVLDPEFFVRWLRAMPGHVVELMCHPGRFDATLVGRDCAENDGLLQQRVNELRWLGDPSFLEAATDAGFRLAAPSELVHQNRPLAKSA